MDKKEYDKINRNKILDILTNKKNASTEEKWDDEKRKIFAKLIEYDYFTACNIMKKFSHISESSVSENEDGKLTAAFAFTEEEVQLMLTLLNKFKEEDCHCLLGNVGYKMNVTKTQINQNEFVRQLNELSKSHLDFCDDIPESSNEGRIYTVDEKVSISPKNSASEFKNRQREKLKEKMAKEAEKTETQKNDKKTNK